MAKKSDILLKVYNDFFEYSKSYKSRLNQLEREFLHVENLKQTYLDTIDREYKEKEENLIEDFYKIELNHQDNLNQIQAKFDSQIKQLNTVILTHNQKTHDVYENEDDVYQEILAQFEERKAEAFSRYLGLTKETNYKIDHEMHVHKEFIKQENEKLDAKQIEYQELNSNLSNQLIWTMEKAKNSLNTLSSSLKDEGILNRDYLQDIISESLENLIDSRDAMSQLFKTSSAKFESERKMVESISKNKRKPHSELNLQMINTFIKQIREVNKNKIAFEKMIKQEYRLSLSQLYPKIIEADNNHKFDDLKQLILQKQIIEKKVEYLLNKNNSMSDLLISKYQNEIKKIKIDSFRRSEEIKLAYSVPVAFFQNSINVYSNFAFYLNETYEELANMLTRFKEFNNEYIDYKKTYIHTSQKTFEDYKINLLVKVNNITNELTEYIREINQISNEIITLESNNRLEIAEIRKKMENLEIFGDYQKYITTLENDKYFAMYQHNQNIRKIQIESNYKNQLLNINKEVLLLNQNKLEYQEYKDYMLQVSKHEQIIHELARTKKIEEAKAIFSQQLEKSFVLSKLAKEKIIYNAKHKSFEYAAGYVRYLSKTKNEEKAGSIQIIDFIQRTQRLIDLNTNQTNNIKKYITASNNNYEYIKILEKNRIDLLNHLEKTTEKKNKLCLSACSLYEAELSKISKEINNITNKYLLTFKKDLLKINNNETDNLSIIKYEGYFDEIISLMDFIYQKTVSLAYKYQVPNIIKLIEKENIKYLEKYIINNYNKFKTIEKKKRKRDFLLNSYLIETILLLEQYLDFSNNIINDILDKITENDRAFIENTIKKADKTRQLINKEYDLLEYQAYKMSSSKNKQLNHLENHSEKINRIYKNQVSKINDEFLKRKDEYSKIEDYIANKYLKIIKKNDKELGQMLRFLDVLFMKEKKFIEKQYKQFNKSLIHIQTSNNNYHKQELVFIKKLYNSREIGTSKTIILLEDKINKLPFEKNQFYLNSKKEKHSLVIKKNKELQKRLSEIEKDKFISRPKYLEEIQNVKNRLPDDYASLYRKIQNLEFNYLNQFNKINDEYTDNYKDYLLNQSGNNEILKRSSKLYSPFENIQKFHEQIIKSTTQTYLDTISKSKQTRELLHKNVQESIDKQKRIINV